MQGHVYAAPANPANLYLFYPPPPTHTHDDARPHMLVHGKRLEGPETYPKGTEGRLVNDQQFIGDLNKYLVKDIRDACARNNNPRAQAKSPDTKSDLIYKCVVAKFLVVGSMPLWSHAMNVVGPR